MKPELAIEIVKNHLSTSRPGLPVPREVQDAARILARRIDESLIREIGEDFGPVELSPFLKSLMRVPDEKMEKPKSTSKNLFGDDDRSNGGSVKAIFGK